MKERCFMLFWRDISRILNSVYVDCYKRRLFYFNSFNPPGSDAASPQALSLEALGLCSTFLAFNLIFESTPEFGSREGSQTWERLPC